MMQSILSLINETLTSTTTSSKGSENASSSEAPKSGTRGEFESILTREDPQTMRCASATRIKARAPSIDERGHEVSSDDESDDEDATTCVNVDDFAAWAITHTIAAPPPSPSMLAMAKNPSLAMCAVKLPSAMNMEAANSDFRNLRNVSTTYASPAPTPLPAADRAGETIPAAALAPKTQEFAAPITQEMMAVQDSTNDSAPISSAITREIPIPTAALQTQEMTAVQPSPYIEKLARSSKATDIPPPSAIPMVSGAPPAFPKARVTKAWDSRSDDSKLAAISTRFASTTPILSDAAFHPTVAVASADPRLVASDTLTFMGQALDMDDTNDARQQAATRAVNQLTLSRAADGEMDIPELGRVRVDAKTNNGEVDVCITADRAETQALVASHTHEIVIDARSAAIPIVDLTVKIDPRAEPQTDFASSQDSSRRRDPRRESDDPSENQANSARRSARARFVL